MNWRKYFIVYASAITISLIVFFAIFNGSRLFQASMEPVPLDGGWLGLLLILANGFFFSYIINRNKLGILERVLLSIGLGFGLTFTKMILLGVLWEFSLLSVILTQVILLITLSVVAVLRGFRINFKALSSFAKRNVRFTGFSIFPALLLIATGILVCVALHTALSLPATEWDSLTYGVNYAKIIFQQGRIPLIAGPSIGLEMSASYPPGVQLTAVSLYVIAGSSNDFYYRMLSPIFSLATMIATYKFATLLNKNRTYSVYAISALSIIPFFWELFIAETYLMALTLMLTLSALFFFKAYNSNSSDAKKYELVGTLFCGFAALTSYIGLSSFGILLLYAVIKRINLKRITWLTTLTLIIILPWYLRNCLLLGNPIYPFLGMGNYLDPLLKSSTAQHFQNYLMLPFYGWSSVICKLCAGVLVAAVAYFTFSKRKDFLTVLPLYLLLVSVGVMGFHVAFPRYLILAIPTLAVVFSFIIKSIPESPKAQLAFSAIFISFIVFSSALMLPYMNTVKPEPQHSEDKWLYLSRIYEEGDAWQWINENTPTDACIATFDIKGYYINRRVLYLDGNQSAPLYKLETIEESIKFLKNRGVDYVLSVPWASPTDKRLPPAYAWCPLTSYLGDPRYLPPVFVGINGTTVYHVCPLESACQGFEEKGMIQPLRHVKVDLTIANNTDPYLGSFYLPIPVDYRGGSLIAQIYTSKPLDVELYSGLIPLSKIEDPLGQYELVKNWTIQSGVNSILQNSSFTWRIDRAGYFTFRFINREKNMLSAFNITFDLNFNSSSFKT